MTCQLTRNGDIKKMTVIGLVANLLLAGLKFIVGFVSSSNVLIADAVHSLSDVASDVGMLIGIRLWSRPKDETHPYGHGRFENLTGIGISVFLFAASVGIIYDAVISFSKPPQASPGWIAFSVAVFSVVFKELLYRWTVYVARNSRSEALLANAWHHRSDAFSSVVAAISIIISELYPNIYYADDIGAIIVAFILLKAGYDIAFSAINKLLDSAAPESLRESLLEDALEIEGVKSAHALRTRYIGADIFVDMHILVDPELSVKEGHDIAMNVSYHLTNKYDSVDDVIVHVEPFGEH